MKTTGLSKLVPKMFRANGNKIVSDGGGRTNKTVVNLSINKKSRKLTYIPNIEAIRELNFLIPNTKKTFNHLWLAFIKA